jgi:hypothetical protein
MTCSKIETLVKLVEKSLKRTELLSFVERDFPHYSWSLRSLDRWLRHFNIYYQDRNVTVAEVSHAVENELEGPGKLLGYSALHKKIRQQCHLKVPRDVVHAAMYNVYPESLENRAPRFKKEEGERSFYH